MSKAQETFGIQFSLTFSGQIFNFCDFKNIALVSLSVGQGAKAKVNWAIIFAYSPTQCSLFMDSSIFCLDFLRDPR